MNETEKISYQMALYRAAKKMAPKIKTDEVTIFDQILKGRNALIADMVARRIIDRQMFFSNLRHYWLVGDDETKTKVEYVWELVEERLAYFP